MPSRTQALPPSRGKGVDTASALHQWIPTYAGMKIGSGRLVGGGEAHDLFHGFHAVAGFDAWCFAAHGFCQEARDVFTVAGESGDVSL